tara:strand:- start:2424 stop:2645 length:222 start_codon:yes stop_codon:yes gene_type:complete
VLVLVVLVVLAVKVMLQQMMVIHQHSGHQVQSLHLEVVVEVYSLILVDLVDQVDLRQEHQHLEGLEDLVEVVL